MSRFKSIIIASGLVLAACGSPAQKVAAPTEADLRLAKAEAMFQERCKTAGERIYRTAENVEGVLLMKLRPEGINYGHTQEQQFRMDDPYGFDVGGDGYIKNFLLGKDERGSLVRSDQTRLGYRYVEASDPKNGQRYRYTGSVRPVGWMKKDAPNIQLALKHNPNFDLNIYSFVLDKTPAPGPMPRYGVTYDDISTREEREYWIAGSSLKVIDLQTNEVMAERIGYMMDRGQGNNSGGRSPWLLAAYYACPSFPATPGGQPFTGYQTRNFVEKTLRIKQEN